MIISYPHIMFIVRRGYPTVFRWIASMCLVIIGCILSSCQSAETSPVPEDTRNPQATQPSGDQGEDPQAIEPTYTPDLKDPDQLQIMWANSAHADTFVVSDEGENNSCARCHDRYNYIPSIEDIPESCYSCKFEVGDPPPYVSEEYWKHVDCIICHQVKKKEVQPEVAWLEFALIEEYSEVSSATDLCHKCHLTEDISGHFSVVVNGDHPDYTCIDCHNAHDLSASCSSTNCHEDVVQPITPIPGHDEDHAQVSCSACHDADGLEIGYVEDLGLWTTLIATGDGNETRPFNSHNIVLEAPCERCHFPGNPWGLTETEGRE
jgi:hypothetical protein